MLTRERLEEVAGAVWAPILKRSWEAGAQTCVCPFCPPARRPWVRTRSASPRFLDSCDPPSLSSRSRRRGSGRPPPVCQMCTQLSGYHCGPSCRQHTSHKLFSLRLRQAEKRICSKVQVVIKTQPVSSQCPGWRPPWFLPLLHANETLLWVQSPADWPCP